MILLNDAVYIPIPFAQSPQVDTDADAKLRSAIQHHDDQAEPKGPGVARPIASATQGSVSGFAAIGLYGSHKLNVLQSEILTAKQVGQYYLKQTLGKGGMGEVFLAQHRMLRRPCAVKLIRAEHAGDASSLARFEREVQAMAKLTHANTVEIYDYGRTDDGTFYYAMEYLPGLSAEELIRRFGMVSPARALHLLRQVCGALGEAHGAGLIHRDIKPANIFICERGKVQDVVKLLDFGLVQLADAEELPVRAAPVEEQELPADGSSSEVKLTQVGHILGTPAYMSPEQASGGTERTAQRYLQPRRSRLSPAKRTAAVCAADGGADAPGPCQGKSTAAVGAPA